MHPFGGTPTCPRCGKAVYAAEQVMGPGRKLYHKPCLRCIACDKRLDSLSLLEHDEEPYCKNCHSRLFGTRDLRQANLPNRDSVGSPPTSPRWRASSPPAGSSSPPPLPARNLPPASSRHATGSSISSVGSLSGEKPGRNGVGLTGSPRIMPTRTLSPTSSSFSSWASRSTTRLDIHENADGINEDESDDPRKYRPTPLSPTRAEHVGPASPRSLTRTNTLGRTNSAFSASLPALVPTLTGTGTRYGVALAGGSPSSAGKQWGGGTPSCGKCGKNVYFAEQVKAVGKTYHRGCLRCTECNTSLDSTRLTEKEGQPFCNRCYGKLYGPAGSGYALLGKAGG